MKYLTIIALVAAAFSLGACAHHDEPSQSMHSTHTASSGYGK